MDAAPNWTVGEPDGEHWEIVVFARNEAASLGPCLRAIASAVAGRSAEVAVILNGTTDDSVGVATRAMRDSALRGRVWRIPHGDKSNAINQYIHALSQPAAVHAFVDGYAEVASDAFRLLSDRLAHAPAAHAAAAVPTSGRGAAAMRGDMVAHPKLHGSLFALRGRFLARLAASGLRLPVGLYRGDGLLGSFVMHDLDAAGTPWSPERVAVEPRATWTVRPLHPWRPADLRRQFRRMVQQGRGRLESAAIRHAIHPGAAAGAGGFAALPTRADRMILGWLTAVPGALPSGFRDPFAALALRRMRHAEAPDASSLVPRLVATVPA